MLRGNHPATVDAKGRLKIPAAFLPELLREGEDFYVTSENGNYARVYPLKAWEELEEKLAKYPTYNQTKRKFLTRTSYYGQMTKVDGQGRVLIPQLLREQAQLSGEVEVLGQEKHLEVWSRNRFAEQELHAKPWTDEDDSHLGEMGI